MKPALVLFLLVLAQTCAAQKVLIPYRAGDAFGLCDRDGKVIVKPQFDAVRWKEGTWFSTSKKLRQTDTLVTAGRRRTIRHGHEARLSGLIHDGAIVLKNEPFDYYLVVAAKCIAAKFEGRGEDLTQEQYGKYGDHRRFYSLFNLKGENMFPENFSRLEMADTTGRSSDGKGPRYILFGAVRFDESRSLFVFDADQQKITDWLIWDAKRVAESQSGPRETPVLTVTNRDGQLSRYVLDKSGGRFLLVPREIAGSAVDRKPPPLQRVEVRDYGSADDAPILAVPPPDEGIATTSTPPAFHAYHGLIGDSLYWITGREEKQAVALPPGSRIIFTEPRARTQYQPLIVRTGAHFYIFRDDKPGAVAYDSLIYFGQYFLAWKTVAGQTRAGVITANDSVIIPMEYDGIVADIRLLRLESSPRSPDYGIVLQEGDSKYKFDYLRNYPYKRDASHLLTVFRKGKCGLINIKGETIIPLEYELIARNDLSHAPPMKDQFLLLKKDGRYGMASLAYSKEKNRDAINMIATPAFSYIPGFYYSDYYGVKDFTLIGLYNEQMVFKGYAAKTGKVYYED